MFESLFSNENTLGPRVKQVKLRERERLFFLIGMMFRCGHTTADGLRTVARAFKSEGNKQIAGALHAMSQRVAQGKPLSKAMENEPVLFHDAHRAAVLAGEAANNMESSFTVLRELETKKINQSRHGMVELLTPLLLLVLSLASVFNTGMNTLPQMAKVAEAQGKSLPAIPQMVMNITNAIGHQWYLLAALILVGVAVLYSIRHSRGGKYLMHSWVLSIPVYGKYLAYQVYTNILLYFPHLLASGVRPKQMIPIMETMATNLVLKRRVEQFNHVITTGGSLSQAMDKAGFPEIAVTPVRVSENFAGETDGVNNLMIEGMQHAHGILENMLEDTHRRFIAGASAILWFAGGMILLIDMVSIVLSQA